MQIRYAVEADLGELIPFYVRMNEVINLRTDHYDPENAVYPSEAMIAAAIAEKGQLIGIEEDRIVAACIISHQCSETYSTVKWQVDAAEDEVWVLHALRVAPEAEGRGYAKQLLAHLIDLAPRRGQKAIRLDVMEGYSVERLYRQLGFRYIDTVEILYEDIGFPKRFRLLEKVVSESAPNKTVSGDF